MIWFWIILWLISFINGYYWERQYNRMYAFAKEALDDWGVYIENDVKATTNALCGTSILMLKWASEHSKEEILEYIEDIEKLQGIQADQKAASIH